MATKTILVVDPDSSVSALIASILREENYDVTTASSLTEANALLSKSRFDLIITEAFRQASQFDFDPSFLSQILLPTYRAPVLLCSTYASLGNLNFDSSIIADVLAKPFDLDDLLVKVERLVNNGGPGKDGRQKRQRKQAA